MPETTRYTSYKKIVKYTHSPRLRWLRRNGDLVLQEAVPWVEQDGTGRVLNRGKDWFDVPVVYDSEAPQ